MQLVDSHCHLNLLDINQEKIDAYVERARVANICHLLNVCVSIKEFHQVLTTAEQYPFVSASVGLHPNEDQEETNYDELIKLGALKKVVAIGETGLDYYRTQHDHAFQQSRFKNHIEASKTLKKPLIIHTRLAIEDTLDMLAASHAEQGVMHCFTETWQHAKRALDLGFHISISGIVTFKNAEAIREVAIKVPLDRLLIETDAPYLAPEPMRGKHNEPAFVTYTAAFIANLRKVPLDIFAEHTTENFFKLFSEAESIHV